MKITGEMYKKECKWIYREIQNTPKKKKIGKKRTNKERKKQKK